MEINGNGKNEKLEIAPLWKSISNQLGNKRKSRMERNFMERGKEWEKEREIKNDKNLEGKREKMEIEGKKGKFRMERCKLMERGKRMESSKLLLLLPLLGCWAQQSNHMLH